MPSKRIQQIDASGIRKVFDLASTLKNPCNLSIGQPDFDTPNPVKQGAIKAILGGRNGYTPTQGIPQLREQVAEHYKRKGAPQEELFITSAVSGAFMLALMATCDVGDELLIPDPFFVMWKDLAKVTGITPRLVDTYPNFRWTREAIEAQITPRTRAIVLASPSNPTGVAISQEEMELIAMVAKEHDLWVIYDEIYETFLYEGTHLNMSTYYPKTITVGGLSKSHSMTGWRVGWAAGPKEVIQGMLRLQQYSFVCAPSIAQWGAVEAMGVAMDQQVAAYKKKRDYMLQHLSGDYEIVKPQGAFYLFIKAPHGMGGEEFVMRALEHELILVPGKVFSSKDTHFRLSYAASDENLSRGVEILTKLAKFTAASRHFTKVLLVES
ncbi:MAG: pyridoxal phosphate-dependent aminotransferase [Parachlamydiales bacterium]